MPEQNLVTEETKVYIAGNFKNTKLGLLRVAKNLNLKDMADADIIRHCHKIILTTPISNIEIRGKNYYFYAREYSAVLTINRSSLGIITAKPYPRHSNSAP